MAKTDDEQGAPGGGLDEKRYTRFERARIIGARALQVGFGAPVLLKMDGPRATLDPVGVAEAEYAEGVVPITVLRPASDQPRPAVAGL